MAIHPDVARSMGMASAVPSKTKLSSLDKAIAHGAGLAGDLASGFPASPVEEPAPKVEPKVEPPKPKEPAPTGYFYLTDMTDGRLPRSGQDHLFPRYAEDHWDEEHHCNIPEADPFYHWDAEVAEGLWLSHTMNEKCMLHGMPGTGKTSAVYQLAAWIRQPYAKFGGKGGIEPASFLGQMVAVAKGVEDADGNEKLMQFMEWKDGLMPPAVREGYLTTIDEFCKISPEIQMAMQSLYEKDGHLMLDDKPGTIREKRVDAHPDFRMMVTDNTLGLGDNMHLFASSEMQDTSTLDRFTIVIPVDYLKKNDEIALLVRKHPDVDRTDISRVCSFAKLVRESYKSADLPVTLSQRGLDAICGIREKGLPLETAINYAFLNKLSDDAHKELAFEQVYSVI